MTAKQLAARMRPRYDAATTYEQKRAVLDEWNREQELVEPEEPPPYDGADPGLDEILEQTMSAWEKRNGRRVPDFKRRAAGDMP